MIQIFSFNQPNHSEAAVTLYPSPTLAPPAPLLKTKTALSFAISSTTFPSVPTGEGNANEAESGTAQSIPTSTTRLLVGCRRKVVLYSWKDGQRHEAKVRIHSMLTLRDDVDLDQGSISPAFSTRCHLSRPRHCVFRLHCHRPCSVPAVYYDSDRYCFPAADNNSFFNSEGGIDRSLWLYVIRIWGKGKGVCRSRG